MDGQTPCRKLNELFDSASFLHSQKIAVEYYNGSVVHYLNYSHVNDQAAYVKEFIKDHVVNSLGDDIQICQDNCGENRKSGSVCIGIFMSENCFIPSILIGIFKAGASYLPLNPLAAKAINVNLIRSAQLCYVLASDELQEQFCADYNFFKLSTCNYFTLQDLNGHKHTFSLLTCNFAVPEGQNISSKEVSNDLAYILSTSGTTGSPKLVYVSHRCILPNIIHLKQIYRLTSRDKVSMCSPLTFDPSVVEIFTTLSAGAALVIVSNAVKCKPFQLAKILFCVAKVSVMQCTPTLFTRFDFNGLKDAFASLRLLVFGGESCPSCKTLKNLLEFAAFSEKEHPRVINIYGITEVSSWSTFYEIEHKDILLGKDASIPLGFPLLDTVLQIVSESQELLCQILSDGNISEACSIGSVRLKVFNSEKWSVLEQRASATGFLLLGGTERKCYLTENRSTISATSTTAVDSLVMRNSGDLVQVVLAKESYEELSTSFQELHDAEFRLYYIGRRDYQIKRHGKRMNTLSVKRKLDQLLIVSASHVMHSNPQNEKYKQYFGNNSRLKNDLLVAFVVLIDGQMASVQTKHKIFQHLRTSLETHSLPDHIVFVDQLPMTCHGKVDDIALMSHIEFENTAKLTFLDLESRILASWSEALNIKGDIGSFELHSNDNFIECGGDSFSAVKFVSLLEIKFEEHEQVFDQTQLFQVILNGTLTDVAACLRKKFKFVKPASEITSCSVLRKLTNTPHSSIQYRKRKLIQTLHEHDKNGIINVTYSLSRGSKTFFHGIEYGSEFATVTKRSRVYKHFPVSPNSCQNLKIDEEWNYDSGKCIDSSPVLVYPCNDPTNGYVIIGSHSHMLASLNIVSGKLNWQIKLDGRIESSACLCSCGNYVVVGCYDHHVYAVEISTGLIYWKFETGDQVKSSPCPGASNSSIVYVGSHDGFLYCLNVQDQRVKWKYNGKGGAIFSSPVFHTINDEKDGDLFSCSLSGHVFCLNASTGAEKWICKLSKPVFSSPAVCESGVCVGCVDSFIYMLQKDAGHIIWKFETKQPVFSSPALITFSDASSDWSQLVVCGSHDGQTYCLNGEDGTLVWKYPGSECSSLPPVYATPFATTVELNNEAYSIAITASIDGTISLLNLHDGRLLTKQKLPGDVFSSPVLCSHDDEWRILVGCRNDYLYCFRLGFSG